LLSRARSSSRPRPDVLRSVWAVLAAQLNAVLDVARGASEIARESPPMVTVFCRTGVDGPIRASLVARRSRQRSCLLRCRASKTPWRCCG
jgi:hypothetical protein